MRVARCIVAASCILLGASCSGDNPAQPEQSPGELMASLESSESESSLRIVKDAVPDSPQDFDFDATGVGVAADIDLDDDADPGLPNFALFDHLAPGGIRTVTESPVAGWTLTDIACTGAAGSTVQIGADGDFDPGDATVTLGLAAGEDVTCTFTNTRNEGSITIVKDAVPNDPQDFDFDATGVGIASDIDLDDDPASALAGSETFSDLGPGSRTISESPAPGWTLTDIACTGATASTIEIGGDADFDPGDVSVTIDLALNEQVTCTFTNSRNDGSITIVKDAVPDAPQDFDFDVTGPGVPADIDLDDDPASALAASETFSNLGPGSRTFTESPVSGWTLTDIGCTGGTASSVQIGNDDDFDAGDAAVTVDLAASEHVTCTFTNTRNGQLVVQKIIADAGPEVFSFSRNPGGAGFALGHGQESTSGFTLPAGVYQVCELDIPVGWTTTVTVGGSNATLVNPDLPADEGDRCVEVTVALNETTTVAFTNTEPPPPGGDARTIGYWKNWSSCSRSRQYARARASGDLDKTLDFYLPTGSALYPIGDIDGAPPLTCPKAVNLLGKSDMNGGKKRASDPAYNLAAQLAAARLNYAAGAHQCAAATQAIADADALLDDIGFTGTGSYSSMSPARKAQAIALAAGLDGYNNNTLCP